MVEKFPHATRALKPIDLNEAKVEHPVSSDVVARISESGKTDRDLLKEQKEMKHL